MKVPFYKPYITGNELKYMADIINNNSDLAGDGVYTKKVHRFFEEKYGVPKALLTTSGTTALELAIRLLGLNPGDEVIVPSFTFSSTVNAILLQAGVKAVFADIESATLNIDPADIERKITGRTKAIMVVHYAGAACDMDRIMAIAGRHGLKVVEDAAQAIGSRYKGRYLGTIGDFGCLSFHGTKNITSGEGGALFINTRDTGIHELAEIIREKGTNRSKFLLGLVDKYTWVDIGGSYLPSDLLAAFLFAQLEQIDRILEMRKRTYEKYLDAMIPLEKKGLISLPRYPAGTEINHHIFFVILRDRVMRDTVMAGLREKGIAASFHYIPLHSAPEGVKLGNDPNSLPVTTEMSGRLLRLPLYSGMPPEESEHVITSLTDILEKRI